MSIKGFIISGSTQKYDYNGLDNKPVIPPGGGGGEVTDALKAALLQLAEKIAYVDANGSAYYDDLYQALYGTAPTTYSVANDLTAVTNSNPATRVAAGGSYSGTLTASTGYTINTVTITMGGNDVTGTSYSGGIITIPNVTGNIVITAVATERTTTLLSIDAVFTQGQAVIYNTDSLNTLKQYLVVTAYYDDTTSEVLSSSAYTLSGTLTTGTSTITASYGGKSDTFTVTVTEYVVPALYKWANLGTSLTDSESGIVATTTGTQDSTNACVLFDTNSKYIDFGEIYAYDRTYTIQFGDSNSTNITGHARFFAVDSDDNTSSGGSVFAYRGNYGFCFYTGSWGETLISGTDKRNIFSNSTLSVYIDSTGKAHAYKDGTLVGSTSGTFKASASGLHVYIGSSSNDYLSPLQIKSMTVYSGEVI